MRESPRKANKQRVARRATDDGALLARWEVNIFPRHRLNRSSSFSSHLPRVFQYLCRDDHATSIFVVDLDGIRLTDFVGETRKFVLTASRLSALHYPERGGKVFLINVPLWFKVIWKAVRPVVAESTLDKIYILRGKDEIREKLLERIPLENIPREYGGTSPVPLGEAPEEKLLADLIAHNNLLAEQRQAVCPGCTKDVDPNDWPCRFCRWRPARSY